MNQIESQPANTTTKNIKNKGFITLNLNIQILPTNYIKNKDELDRIKTYKYYQTIISKIRMNQIEY